MRDMWDAAVPKKERSKKVVVQKILVKDTTF